MCLHHLTVYISYTHDIYYEMCVGRSTLPTVTTKHSRSRLEVYFTGRLFSNLNSVSLMVRPIINGAESTSMLPVPEAVNQEYC